MRRTRRQSGGKIGFVMVIIGCGVLAVIIGYFLGTYAMQAFLSGVDPEPSPDDPQTPVDEQPSDDEDTAIRMTLQVPAITLYRLQVGAFSSRDNALDLASDLRQDGIHPYVGTEPPYRVIAAAASDGEAVSVLVPVIEQRGYPVYVSEWVLPGGTMTVSGDEDYLTWYEQEIIRLVEAINQQAILWSDILTGQATASGLDDLEAKVRQLQADTVTQTVDANWEVVHGRLRDLTQVAVQSVAEMRSVAADKIEDNNWESAMSLFLDVISGFELLCSDMGGQE